MIITESMYAAALGCLLEHINALHPVCPNVSDCQICLDRQSANEILDGEPVIATSKNHNFGLSAMDKEIIGEAMKFNATGIDPAMWEDVRELDAKYVELVGLAKEKGITVIDVDFSDSPVNREEYGAAMKKAIEEVSALVKNADVGFDADPYDEPEDAETISDECYYCGKTFDTGFTSKEERFAKQGWLVSTPWCGTCTMTEDEEDTGG
jgi:hypothetical protein